MEYTATLLIIHRKSVIDIAYHAFSMYPFSIINPSLFEIVPNSLQNSTIQTISQHLMDNVSHAFIII